MAVALYSDLPPDECARRLGASGWAGEAKPRRWQPAAADRDIFRVIRGRTFQLWSRAATFPGDTSSPFPQYFHGRLQPHGQGTLVRGYYGASKRMKIGMTIGIFLGFLALASLDNVYDFKGNGTQPWPAFLITVMVISALLLGLYWALDWRNQRNVAESEAYFAAFLMETLEARPADAAFARPRLPRRQHRGRSGG